MNDVVIITVAVSVAGLIHGIIMRTFNVKLKAIQNQINNIKEDVYNEIKEIKETVYRIEKDLKNELNRLEEVINTKVDSRLNRLNNHVIELRERVAKMEAKQNEK